MPSAGLAPSTYVTHPNQANLSLLSWKAQYAQSPLSGLEHSSAEGVKCVFGSGGGMLSPKFGRIMPWPIGSKRRVRPQGPHGPDWGRSWQDGEGGPGPPPGAHGLLASPNRRVI